MPGSVFRSACSCAAASAAAAVARHDCCVVVVDLVVAVAATLVFAVASDCCAAASAAAVVARHACRFFFKHQADVSSTGIDLHASGRSPQTSCIYNGAYDVICVFRPTSRAASSKHGR